LTGATSNSGDEFGSAVAFDGDWAVVGAPGNDGTGAGYVFSRDSTGWVERCRLALDGGGGSLGAAVALSGKSALLGDPTSNATILQGGAAYLFDVDSVQGYGCTAANPPGSLVPVSGAPALGRTWTLGVHNPLGTQPAGSLAYLGVGGAPAAYPCGDLVPNWGMAGAGASGELLLASAPEPILVGPTAWDGLSPAPVALTLPADPAFAGQTIFVQGLMLDTSGAQVGIGLTEAVSACIGVPVP